MGETPLLPALGSCSGTELVVWELEPWGTGWRGETTQLAGMGLAAPHHSGIDFGSVLRRLLLGYG